MSTTPSSRTVPQPRIVVGAAHAMQLDGIEGRVLFPSPDFSHWPPFEGLAEIATVGAGPPVLHPHEGEEVVTYVLEGSLREIDADGRATGIPAGWASVLTVPGRRMHDVDPPAGTSARWISLTVRLGARAANGPDSWQSAAALPQPSPTPGLRPARLVGAAGPVRSSVGLEMSELVAERDADWSLPIGPRRTAVAYVLAGALGLDGRPVRPGEGALIEGYETVPITLVSGTRAVVASVPMPTW